MELQRSGFSDEEIRAHENELRQNSRSNTARALKEHFILERIAEEEKIEPVEADYDAEIRLIAPQSERDRRGGCGPAGKEGMMDVLRNQMIERKVVDLILSQAEFKEVPYQPGRQRRGGHRPGGRRRRGIGDSRGQAGDRSPSRKHESCERPQAAKS